MLVLSLLSTPAVGGSMGAGYRGGAEGLAARLSACGGTLSTRRGVTFSPCTLYPAPCALSRRGVASRERCGR